MEEAASAAVAAVVVADTEIVNPDGARDTSRRRGTTIRYITEPGAIPAFLLTHVIFQADRYHQFFEVVISSTYLTKESTRDCDLI